MPSKRTAALYGLLIVGLLCSFGFHIAVSDMSVSYTATAIDSDTQPSRVAHASTNVTNLDEQLASLSATQRQPVTDAAQSGSFVGPVSPALSIALNETRGEFAVYDGEYYEWSLTTSEETTTIDLQMRPVDAETVLATVAAPAETAPQKVQTAIDSGHTTGWNLPEGVYRQDGTYYAVVPDSETAIATSILGGFIGFVLTPVGRGYVAVALGLLLYRYREPLVAEPLTLRRAVGVATLAAPVAVFGTALFESGSASRFITGPASAIVVAAGVVAGVLACQRRWLHLGGFTVLVSGLTIAAMVVGLGPVGFILGPLTVVLGLIAGVIPLIYGVVFTPAQTTLSETT
jgi:hypothetical protein